MRLPESSDLWAVTSYFNPAGYESRLRNFRIFREALEIPLLAVELAGPAGPVLRTEDADQLLRVEGDPRIWQKERLLNLGIAALPPQVRFVAWLDCDVIFLSPGWSARARDLLEEQRALLQPYTAVHHVGHPSPGCGHDVRAIRFTQQSFARAHGRNLFAGADPMTRFISPLVMESTPAPRDLDETRPSPGFAWAARREDLEKFPLYEFHVLGGGDSALAYATIDRPDLHERGLLSTAHASHYAAWARRAHHYWDGCLRSLEADLAHLPHGRLQDRDYLGRSRILREGAFDPERDLHGVPGEGWRWAAHRESMAEEVARYFEARREDGPAA